MRRYQHLFPAGAILLIFLAIISRSTASGADLIAGADLSHLAFFESRGILYRDETGSGDALAILKRRGLNCVRLRLFTSTAEQAMNDPYNRINNLEYTAALAARVKKAGLQLLLDFHYSDTWADPGKQAKPAPWTNLAFTLLVQELRAYNSNSIASFKSAGAMPDYVQIGNEIISGMLWPDGQVGGARDTPAQWQKFGQLINSAIQGVKDASGPEPPKFIIHIDRGGDWAGTQWFFDHLGQQGVDFDIIGQSYYPFWHGSFTSLRTCLNNAAKRYGKPLLIAETAFPWSNSTNIYGIPATPAGQVEFIATLAQTITSLPNGLGRGLVWWGTEYQRLNGVGLAGFDRRSFFDASGNALPVAEAVGQLAAPLFLKGNLAPTAVVLEWPLSGAGFSLMTATNLPPSPPWSRITNTVQSTGTVIRLTLPLDSPHSRFYRLQSN